MRGKGVTSRTRSQRRVWGAALLAALLTLLVPACGALAVAAYADEPEGIVRLEVSATHGVIWGGENEATLVEILDRLTQFMEENQSIIISGLKISTVGGYKLTEADFTALRGYLQMKAPSVERIDLLGAALTNDKLPDGAFANCTNLALLVMGAPPLEIGTGAFAGLDFLSILAYGTNEYSGEEWEAFRETLEESGTTVDVIFYLGSETLEQRHTLHILPGANRTLTVPALYSQLKGGPVLSDDLTWEKQVGTEWAASGKMTADAALAFNPFAAEDVGAYRLTVKTTSETPAVVLCSFGIDVIPINASIFWDVDAMDDETTSTTLGLFEGNTLEQFIAYDHHRAREDCALEGLYRTYSKGEYSDKWDLMTPLTYDHSGMKLYAKWKDTVSIKIYDDGDEPIFDEEVAIGETLEEIAEELFVNIEGEPIELYAPRLEGMWSLEIPLATWHDPLTLYVYREELEPNIVTVYIDLIYAEDVMMVQVPKGRSLADEWKSPTRTGYTFAGLYEDKEYKTEAWNMKTPLYREMHGLMLYVKWTKLETPPTDNGNTDDSGSPSKPTNPTTPETPTTPGDPATAKPVTTMPQDDGTLSAAVPLQGADGNEAKPTGIPTTENSSALKQLESMGLSAAIVNGELVISGTATDIGNVKLTVEIENADGKKETVTVQVTVSPVSHNNAPNVDTTPGNWTGKITNGDFVLYIPITVSGTIHDLLVTASNGTVTSLTVTSSREVTSYATDAGRGASTWIKVTGTTSDPSAVRIKSVSYRSGIHKYTQSLNVSLGQTNAVDATTNQSVDSTGDGGGGGCDAGLALAACGALALSRRRRGH